MPGVAKGIPTIDVLQADNLGDRGAASETPEADEAGSARHSAQGGAASLLLSQPIFRGLDLETLEEIVAQAEPQLLKEGDVLILTDGMMFLVEDGAVEVSIGFGPSVEARRGRAVNVAGMLGVSQALTTSSHGSAADDQGSAGQRQPYEVLSHVATFEQLSKWKINAVGQHQSPCFDETACMSRLCPDAAIQSPGQPLTRRATNAAIASRCQRLTVRAAAGRGGAAAGARSGGVAATIRGISLHLVEEVLSLQEDGDQFPATTPEELLLPSPGALARFQGNRDDLLEKAFAISKCSLFPDAPAEVIWALAELSQLHNVHPGQKVITEGEAGDSLVIIGQGEAVVEKIVGDAQKSVGRVGSGAIIGDICLVGVNVPRPATVVAGTEVLAIDVPAAAVLTVLGQFPGLSAQMVHRLTAVTRQLQAGLPPWAEVLSSVKIFSSSDLQFLDALALECERHVAYCGSLLREAGSKDGSLYVVQHGICSLESADGEGAASEIPQGSCFGWKTPVGSFGSSNGAVRAVTPIVVALKVPKTVFSSVLTRYPGESKRLCSRGDSEQEGVTLSHIIRDIKLFSACSLEFLEEVEQAADIMYYMPNQTLCVEGSVDEAHFMFLRGGQCCLERYGGKGPIILQAGSTFGERAFLGVVRRRTATIRALTVCVTVEISRASVLLILENHPKERKLFEQLAMQSMSETDGIRWPVLRDATSQLSFMLNLYAERRVLAKGDLSAGTIFASESVVLLMHGQLAVLDADGREVEHLTPGSCFNEQILLDVPHVPGRYYVPKSSCEVQIIRKEMWQHVMESFPQEQEKIRRNIIKVMAMKAERKLGFAPGGDGMLSCSALFRSVSSNFAEVLRSHLEELIYEPGEVIIEDGEEGNSMYVLLDGNATARACGSMTALPQPVGKAFGEAVLLGAARIYNVTVQAASHCVVLMLRRCHWEEALNSHPAELQLFEEVLAMSERSGNGALRDRLQRSPTFRKCDADFLAMFFTHAIHSFFAPGEELLDDCHGSSPFVLLAGGVTIKDKLGFTLSDIKPGEMFGEGDCLGLEDVHAATAFAAKKGLVHCVRLHRESMKAALRDYPAETQVLRDRFVKRRAVHESSVTSRHSFLTTLVLPTLRASVIFSRCSDEMLFRIASGLSPVAHKQGDVIASAGVPANSMLFLLEGSADVLARDGRVVGKLTQGAWIDEVVALGLFRCHTATVKATSACSVLAVPAKAIVDVEQGFQGEYSPQGRFQKLRESRRAQVAEALPISALPLSVGADDVAARAVALQAERIGLGVNERLTPLSDSSPCGPHFLVFVRGRATVEMASNGLPVQNITRGAPISEGLAAEHGACIRAVTQCEAYRVRHGDFKTAVGQEVKWLGDFLTLEQQCWNTLRARLLSAEGVGRLFKTGKRSTSSPHLESTHSCTTLALPCEEECSARSSGSRHEVTMTSTPPRPWTSPESPSQQRRLASLVRPLGRCSTALDSGRHSPLRRAVSTSRLTHMRGRGKPVAGIRSILQLRRDLKQEGPL